MPDDEGGMGLTLRGALRGAPLVKVTASAAYGSIRMLVTLELIVALTPAARIPTSPVASTPARAPAPSVAEKPSGNPTCAVSGLLGSVGAACLNTVPATLYEVAVDRHIHADAVPRVLCDGGAQSHGLERHELAGLVHRRQHEGGWGDRHELRHAPAVAVAREREMPILEREPARPSPRL